VKGKSWQIYKRDHQTSVTPQIHDSNKLLQKTFLNVQLLLAKGFLANALRFLMFLSRENRSAKNYLQPIFCLQIGLNSFTIDGIENCF
jgi:hypothetical protein